MRLTVVLETPPTKLEAFKALQAAPTWTTASEDRASKVKAHRKQNANAPAAGHSKPTALILRAQARLHAAVYREVLEARQRGEAPDELRRGRAGLHLGPRNPALRMGKCQVKEQRF